ncbi:MAG: DUF87 domain-containing protein [Acidobacteriia bacterium]|nr:DUF87 domain-containing protein [Terriglobia bacterium]
MQDYEKMGAFYLGRAYDLDTRMTKEDLILYDSKDLVTHAVCVGMTGSGKTGLCIALLEEAAIDNIPAIIIDPKGDLANLLLTFPQLRSEDFLPWINVEDAQRKGLTPQAYAGQQAELWKKGLADWGQTGDRIRSLQDAADIAIYTPGSSAGIPVSILKSFSAPDPAIRDDGELLRERIETTVTSLLALLGIEADPIRSREHILLSTILDWAWKQGRDLDPAALIQYIQVPPVSRIGVLDLDTFYPPKDRFALVMALNNMLAAPGFGSWLEGEALDIGRVLHGASGKPRLAVFSVAHLDDAGRMFFVSLLLNQVLGWMRTQSGTTSLRAVLYMDEIFGYFPPVANPPSKKPLLTLLKQARAFGLGIVLATQNPVDLDYKGLSNAGTWFIGRLQTDRDKQRVLDGLEGAAAGAGSGFDRQRMEQVLAGLSNRVFLMNNTHEDAPVVFQSRWTLSYLRGPLTRDQIRVLMDPRKASSPAPPPVESPALPAAPAAPAVSAAPMPSLPPEVSQFFIPARGNKPAGSRLLYQPAIFGAARVNFVDARTKVEALQEAVFTTPVTDEAVPVSWDKAQAAQVAVSDLEKSPQDAPQFAELPAAAARAKNYPAWNKDFVSWLYGTQSLQLFRSPGTGVCAGPGETERDFRIRLQQTARERRDQMVAELRQRYAPRVAALQERIRRAQEAVEREQAQARQQKIQTAISFGTTLLGAVLGRKTVSASTLGRAATAARGVGRTIKEGQDVGRAEETAAVLQQQLADLNAEAETAAAGLQSRVDPLTELLETITIKPKKTDISVQLVTLVWLPYWCHAQGTATPAWI